MKIPGNISSTQLAKKLKKYRHEVTQQTGSHIRLTSQLNNEHHITVPAHNPIRIGTLSSILNDVANHLKMTKAELVKELWG